MMDFDIAGMIEKVDTDKRQVFGWASIAELDGMPVIDRQGDVIMIEELEKAAYDYVLDSRVGGEMHQKITDGGVSKASKPKQIGRMIESFVFTPEKIEKMGLPDSTPTGWWIGFKVDDDKVWSKVKKGQYAGFSIHGVGARKKVSKSEILKMSVAKASQRDLLTRMKAAGITSEVLSKHLLGRHEQDDHNPNRKRNPRLAEAKAPHRRKDHRTIEEKNRTKARGRKYSRAVGQATALGAAPFIASTAAEMSSGVPMDAAMRTASQPYKNIARSASSGVKRVVSTINKSDDVKSEDVDIIKLARFLGMSSDDIRRMNG
jgi:hypothetical protein